MPTGIVKRWNGRCGSIAPDASVPMRSLFFSRMRLMDGYVPQRGDAVSFGLNRGASKKVRYATYVAKIEEEPTHVNPP